MDLRAAIAKGPEIDRLRRDKGWTIENLALRASQVEPPTVDGPHEATIKRAVRSRPIRLDNLRRIADALGVPLSQIARMPTAVVESPGSSKDDSGLASMTEPDRKYLELGQMGLNTRLSQDLAPAFELVPLSAECSPSESADLFYDGFPPTWEDLAAGFDIPRHVYTSSGRLQTSLASALQTKGLSVLALIGVAGTGKTTVLRRLGLNLRDTGYIVLRLREDWHQFSFSLAAQINDLAKRIENTIVVLIDDAADLVFERNVLDATLREVRQASTAKAIVLVCADDTNRWLAAMSRVPCSVAETITVHDLLPSECESLVDKILLFEGNQTLQALTGLTRLERLELVERTAKRQLLVAMLQMRHGQEFQNIIRAEFERVPQLEAQHAYALICQFNSLGFSIPERALLAAAGITGSRQLSQFDDSLAALIREESLGLAARHQVIARVVAAHAFKTSASREAAICEVLVSLRPAFPKEHDLFVKLFIRHHSYRNLVLLVGRKTDKIQSFYQAVRSIVQAHWPPDILKYVASAEGMSASFLREPTWARSCFREASHVDPRYEFAARQRAWLEHYEGNWELAAKFALHAMSLANDNFDTIYQGARILSLNTVRHFRVAKQYLLRAKELDPTHQMCIKAYEEYLEAEKIVALITNLREDSLIPEFIAKELRPGFAYWRALFGVNDNRFRERLRWKLQAMQSEVSGEIGDLYDTLAGIEPKNKIDKSLVSSNLARLMYLEWYSRGEPHDPKDIESAFKTSLDLNSRDPFTHCWYGTFLKEVRRDFAGARKEYETALRLGNASENSRLKDHPLFLNNLALLDLDEIQIGRIPREQLVAVRVSLRRAVSRVSEMRSEFHWPEQTLERCEALLDDYGIVSEPSSV